MEQKLGGIASHPACIHIANLILIVKEELNYGTISFETLNI